ncbi:MAG: 2-oxoacid:acceptor oxidoreductase subunit alpha [Cyclobacteriaceae bacterium]|nr:2-oxoacid:acceptor oxidoreductase subunit alpha [Cyclobacteriaceae bacterium]
MSNDTMTTPAVKSQNTKAKIIGEHILEIVSDSGEGAQKCGQSFASISAKMGNGVWTVEIIPAEIQPPARTREGASGIRVRVGSKKITNMGNEADLLVAFNEQVPYSRIVQNAYREGTVMLLESKWATHSSEEVKEKYASAVEDFKRQGIDVREIPMEVECLKLVKNPRKGKNMWVLGMLSHVYQRDLSRAEEQVRYVFKKKKDEVIEANLGLLRAGYQWASDHLDLIYEIPVLPTEEKLVVMNGNEAIGMGVLAAGIEVVSMYPITPATSASHYLADVLDRAGGVVHQAEDEIAAIGFAIGASYAGKTAITITSGPGIALKTEFIGLAAMAEVPLVIVDVQRGGPSTGLPTKVEQGDLLAVLYGQPGDSPKVVLAASTIEECFQFIVLARKLAETFRIPVFVLTDANLATGQQPFPRPKAEKDWFSPPIDQSPWKEGVKPFDWNMETGLSRRPIPGQAGGIYTLTGLAHDENGIVSYNPDNNQKTSELRSKKLATIKKTLNPPVIHGEESGDLLIVSWGSTLGAIEEAVDQAIALDAKVSTLHLRFLSPMEPGLKEIFKRFKKVLAIEINYSDDAKAPYVDEENRRYSQLAWILRAQTLVDIDSFSNVKGQPLQPKIILAKIKEELNIK